MKIHGLLTLFCACSLATACSGSAPAPAAGPIAAAAPKPSVESLTIAFNDASATLSPDAQHQLDGAARLYREAGPEVMIVSGHTDKSGDEFKNVLLSARRAEQIKQALVDRGVPANKLQIVAVGEAEPVPGIPPSRAAIVTWR
jgi:OOP family OmpA-OmpF porin